MRQVLKGEPVKNWYSIEVYRNYCSNQYTSEYLYVVRGWYIRYVLTRDLLKPVRSDDAIDQQLTTGFHDRSTKRKYRNIFIDEQMKMEIDVERPWLSIPWHRGIIANSCWPTVPIQIKYTSSSCCRRIILSTTGTSGYLPNNYSTYTQLWCEVLQSLVARKKAPSNSSKYRAPDR